MGGIGGWGGGGLGDEGGGGGLGGADCVSARLPVGAAVALMACSEALPPSPSRECAPHVRVIEQAPVRQVPWNRVTLVSGPRLPPLVLFMLAAMAVLLTDSAASSCWANAAARVALASK